MEIYFFKLNNFCTVQNVYSTPLSTNKPSQQTILILHFKKLSVLFSSWAPKMSPQGKNVLCCYTAILHTHNQTKPVHSIAQLRFFINSFLTTYKIIHLLWHTSRALKSFLAFHVFTDIQQRHQGGLVHFFLSITESPDSEMHKKATETNDSIIALHKLMQFNLY